MKACRKCGERKPLEAFYKQKRRNGSLRPMSHCKECVKDRARAYYRATGDTRRAQKRAYVQAHRKDEARRKTEWLARVGNRKRKHEVDRKWREDNQARKAATDKRWARENREQVRRNHREWSRQNPHRIRLNSWVQGQKRRGEVPTRETQNYREVLAADPCSYCGALSKEADHIIPRTAWDLDVAGWNEWNNLTASCQSCNRRKSARSLLTFLLV